MLEFNPARLIYYKDMERNPYLLGTPENIKWSKEDDKRLLLLALERYIMILDYIRQTENHRTMLIHAGWYDDSPIYKYLKRRGG